MVFAEALTGYYEADLAERVSRTRPLPLPETLSVDRYVAMSALQKAVRRGNDSVALRAAATLLRMNARAFWRRLGVIAFEDIGVANLDLVGSVVVALGDTRLRRSLGGDWEVAAALSTALCRSRKDRAVDDLLMRTLCVTGQVPGEEAVFGLPFSERIACAIDCHRPLEAQALAAWSCIGTRRLRLTELPMTEGCSQSYFDRLHEAGYPAAAIEIARLGFRRLADAMSPLFPLVYQRVAGGTFPASDDRLTPETSLRGVPSPAFDKHTRVGLAAYALYLERSMRMRDYLANVVPGGRSLRRIVGMLAFRAEGVLEVNRLRWPEGERLRAAADLVGIGIPPDTVPEGLAILRAEIDLLNSCRADVLARWL